VRLGSLTFTLRGNDLLWRDTFTFRTDYVTYLTQDLTYTATTIFLHTAGIAVGTLLHLEREVVQILLDSGGGQYTVQRARLGTQRSAHPVGVELYDTASPHALAGRIVQLYRVPASATGYADEELRWTGVLRSLSTPNGGGRVELQCDPLISLVRGTSLMRNQWRGWTGPRDTMGLNNRAAPDAGYTGDATTQRGLFMVDGSAYALSWIREGEGYGIDTQGARELYRGAQALDADTEGSYLPAGKEVKEFFSTSAQQPPSSAAPSTDTLPLSQDAATLILQLLTTTPSGGAPGNGPYDLGVPNLAGDIPQDLIDVDGILDWGRRYGSILPVDNLIIGADDDADLYEIIQKRILQPRGASLTQTRGGLLGIAQLADVPRWGSSSLIDQSAVLEVGLPTSRTLEDAVGAIKMTYATPPGGEGSTVEVVDARKGRVLPRGSYETLEIDAGAYYSPSLSKGLALGLAQRFSTTPPTLTLKVLRTQDYYPGDVVRLTHALAFPASYAAQGARGVEDAVMLVTARGEHISPQEHSVTLTLLYVGALYSSQGLIAPSAEVVSWDGGTLTITVQPNAYTDAAGVDLPANDAEGFVAGDVIQIVDQYGSPVTSGLTVASVGASTVVLTATPATLPGAGDVMRLNTYAASTVASRADWTYIADASDHLGGSAADAKGYTL